MDEVPFESYRFVSEYIHGVFAESSVALLLVGLICLIFGLLVLFVTIYIRFAGYRVAGRVVGALKDIQPTESNRKGKAEIKSNTKYYAVFEYQRPDGSLHREKASEGGSHVMKYLTGQAVNLIVIPHNEFDDVYDADKNTGMVISGILLCLGIALMMFTSTALVAFGISAIALLTSAVILLIKLVAGILGNNRQNTKYSKTDKSCKYFDPRDVRPIEDYLSESEP